MATFAPHVTKAVLEINARFPALGKGGTYPGHGEDPPGEKYAADFWSTSKSVHDDVLAWVIEHHKRLGVKYIITWKRIWSDARSSEGVRVYTRYGSSGTPSQLHTNHVHISFNEDPPKEAPEVVTDGDIKKIADASAERTLDLDGKIKNKDEAGYIFDANAGAEISLKNALYEIGKDLRSIKKALKLP